MEPLIGELNGGDTQWKMPLQHLLTALRLVTQCMCACGILQISITTMQTKAIASESIYVAMSHMRASAVAR